MGFGDITDPTLTAQQVWEYTARILTNLSDARASKIDNLDAGISTRAPASEYDATLTALGVSVLTRAPSGEYDTQMGRLDVAVSTRKGLSEESQDTLTADGSEQDVVEITSLGQLEGFIDLANMQSGDGITIKEYIKLKSGGTYRLYDSASYSGAQSLPALHVVKLPAKYGAKVTLEQTAGTNRDYDYNFFKEA